jgi:hypothetical protein
MLSSQKRVTTRERPLVNVAVLVRACAERQWAISVVVSNSVGSLRRTGSLRTAVSVAGKRIFEGRDKELERASQVQERRCKSRHAVTLRGGLFKLHHGGLDVLTPRTFEVPQNVSRLLCFNAR